MTWQSDQQYPDSPVVTENCCLACHPERSLRELILDHPCPEHTPTGAGSEDELSRTSGSMPISSYPAGGHVNRAACAFFHRGEPLPADVPEDPPFQPEPPVVHGKDCVCCEFVEALSLERRA